MTVKGVDGPFPTIAHNFKKYYSEGKLLKNEGLTKIGDEPFRAQQVDCSKTKEKDCEYEYGTPIANEYHLAQIYIGQRFQER